MGFFDYCVSCGKMFTDEKSFNEHREMHRRRREAQDGERKKGSVELVESPEPVPVPEVEPEIPEEKLAAIGGVRQKRKKLIAAGIEAATMTAREVEERYDKEKGRGKVK